MNKGWQMHPAAEGCDQPVLGGRSTYLAGPRASTGGHRANRNGIARSLVRLVLATATVAALVAVLLLPGQPWWLRVVAGVGILLGLISCLLRFAAHRV